jgi:hypothetical protein
MWQRYSEGGLKTQAPSFSSVAKARQTAFYNKAPQLNPVPPSLPNQSFHLASAKDRKASSSLPWEETAFYKQVNPSFLFSKMADVMVFYGVNAYLAH